MAAGGGSSAGMGRGAKGGWLGGQGQGAERQSESGAAVVVEVSSETATAASAFVPFAKQIDDLAAKTAAARGFDTLRDSRA